MLKLVKSLEFSRKIVFIALNESLYLFFKRCIESHSRVPFIVISVYLLATNQRCKLYLRDWIYNFPNLFIRNFRKTFTVSRSISALVLPSMFTEIEHSIAKGITRNCNALQIQNVLFVFSREHPTLRDIPFRSCCTPTMVVLPNGSYRFFRQTHHRINRGTGQRGTFPCLHLIFPHYAARRVARVRLSIVYRFSTRSVFPPNGIACVNRATCTSVRGWPTVSMGSHRVTYRNRWTAKWLFFKLPKEFSDPIIPILMNVCMRVKHNGVILFSAENQFEEVN